MKARRYRNVGYSIQHRYLAAPVVTISLILLGGVAHNAVSATKSDRILVFRRTDIPAHESAAASFRDYFYRSSQLVAIGDRISPAESSPRLVFALGVEAQTIAQRFSPRPQIIHAYAFGRHKRGTYSLNYDDLAAPALEIFLSARRKSKTLAIVHDRTGMNLETRFRRLAVRKNIQVLSLNVETAAEALRRLIQLPGAVDGLWLMPSLSTMSPQLLSYAISLQFRRNIPLLAASRGQARRGAAFALDYSPRKIGRSASRLAAHLLNPQFRQRFGKRSYGGPRIPVRLSINQRTAKRIGLALRDLSHGLRIDP